MSSNDSFNGFGVRDEEQENQRALYVMSQPTREDQRDFLKKMLTFSLLFVLSVIQFGTWGRDGVSIIYYKSARIIGVAGTSQLKTLNEICMRNQRVTCAADALVGLTESEPSAENFLKAADFHRLVGQNREAISFYQKGLQVSAPTADTNRDQQVKILFGLAKSFEAVGQGDKAIESYELAIKAKPEVILVTVTEAYVKLLQKSNLHQAAEAVIKEARKRGHSKSMFAYLQTK